MMKRHASSAIALGLVAALPGSALAHGEKATPIERTEIPNLPGKQLIAVNVDYAPGGTSDAHRHPQSAFIFAYVVSGAVESAVNDEPAKTFKAGESWTEKPGDLHRVSRNASKTKPARLLAVFVVDANAGALSTPEK